VRAIVGQQVTVAAANTITGRLVERHGRLVPGLAQLGLSHTFPDAGTLAAADLSGVGLTRARAAAVGTFARAVAESTVRLDRGVSLDRLVASLTALDGVGAWTAHYLALRLGEPDACPITDLGLQRALAQRVPRSATLQEVSERWRPWRSLATTHLWFADEGRPAQRVGRDAVRGAA
jgi:AraC family transcriptional regulator of adaptative response / DNA-3-methyladenine glycosylase II